MRGIARYAYLTSEWRVDVGHTLGHHYGSGRLPTKTITILHVYLRWWGHENPIHIHLRSHQNFRSTSGRAPPKIYLYLLCLTDKKNKTQKRRAEEHMHARHHRYEPNQQLLGWLEIVMHYLTFGPAVGENISMLPLTVHRLLD